MNLKKLSESVFAGLCLRLGTSQQVNARRDIADVKELLVNQVTRTWHGQNVFMMSGSRKEGFRFSDSDIDVMRWPNNHRVLWDFSQTHLYNLRQQVMILSDSSESPPGFTLLWLPLEVAPSIVLMACVRYHGSLYIFSAKYREVTLTLSRPDATIHGPCSSGRRGPIEYDDAHCFFSDFWPPSAAGWIERCCSWPQPCVVEDIVRNGCHFVPIGSKHGNHVNNEWRISFSQAEQTLMYYMNHSQFCTYGLLKLFLKEIVNFGLQEDEKLLCSYHMKTAVFWAIQQNTLAHWCPQNLLTGFWLCFKFLLKWVYDGVCPNFFIPENNMFLNKVHGAAQNNLFCQLYGLYEKGIAFLLQSPSINSCIMDVLCNPKLSVCTDERILIHETIFDRELFDEIFMNDVLPFGDLNICLDFLKVLEQLAMSNCTQFQALMLQKLIATYIQASAFTLHNNYMNRSSVNKHMYVIDKISLNMLKIATKFGFVSDMLYIAMYYYKTHRFREALSVIEMIKGRLEKPGLMYMSNIDVNPQTYMHIGYAGGLSWSLKMRKTVTDFISLRNWVPYIDELQIEQQFCFQNDQYVLYISPFIMLHMLEFLCYRHVDPTRKQAALDDLQLLVHHGLDELDVCVKDISWEILGICQQIDGNLQAALFSYQQSLRELPLNRMQPATIYRIQDLNLPYM